MVAAGSGERLGIDRPKAFAGLGEAAIARREPRAARRCELVDAIVVAAPPGLGGARDPPRRGARGHEGRRLRHGRRDPRGVGRGGALRGSQRRSWCSSTTRHARSSTDAVVERFSPARGGVRRGGSGASRSRIPSSASAMGRSWRPSIATVSSRPRRRKRFSRRRSAGVLGRSHRSDRLRVSRRARGGRVAVVEGDPRLVKVTTPADLALVESWL